MPAYGEETLEKALGSCRDSARLLVQTLRHLGLAARVVSGLLAREGHIPLACTPQPSSAAPIDGLIDPFEVEFGFSNTVTRIREDPRVTLPYSDGDWAAIRRSAMRSTHSPCDRLSCACV